MSAEDNKKSAQDGYEAFGRGDGDAAMKDFHDDVEWVVGGDNKLTGTKKGKHEVGEYFVAIGEAGLTTSPKEFIAEGDKVVVIAEVSADGNSATNADVFTFDSDGKVIHAQTYGNQSLLDEKLGH